MEATESYLVQHGGQVVRARCQVPGGLTVFTVTVASVPGLCLSGPQSLAASPPYSGLSVTQATSLAAGRRAPTSALRPGRADLAALCATVSRRRLPWCAVPRSPLLSPLCFTACRVLFGPCAKQARRPSPLRSSALLSSSHFGKLDPTNAGAACQRGTNRHQSPRPQQPITAPWLQLYDCTHR